MLGHADATASRAPRVLCEVRNDDDTIRRVSQRVDPEEQHEKPLAARRVGVWELPQGESPGALRSVRVATVGGFKLTAERELQAPGRRRALVPGVLGAVQWQLHGRVGLQASK